MGWNKEKLINEYERREPESSSNSQWTKDLQWINEGCRVSQREANEHTEPVAPRRIYVDSHESRIVAQLVKIEKRCRLLYWGIALTTTMALIEGCALAVRP